MAPRQPPGVIPDGCRAASPSATWRADPHTRQVPGAAPPSVPHGHHPTPGSRRGDGGTPRPGWADPQPPVRPTWPDHREPARPRSGTGPSPARSLRSWQGRPQPAPPIRVTARSSLRWWAIVTTGQRRIRVSTSLRSSASAQSCLDW